MNDTISLGGHVFALRPPTLGQLRPVLDALDAMAGKTGGALVEAAAALVAAGLTPAHPGTTAETLLDLAASLDELNAAVAAVLRVAGLQRVENPAGESQPVAILAPSTPPSPPAAATPIATSTR